MAPFQGWQEASGLPRRSSRRVGTMPTAPLPRPVEQRPGAGKTWREDAPACVQYTYKRKRPSSTDLAPTAALAGYGCGGSSLPCRRRPLGGWRCPANLVAHHLKASWAGDAAQSLARAALWLP